MSALELRELACAVPHGLRDDVVTRAAAQQARIPVVALVGRPNVGKSTFLAHVSGSYVETANLPGTTVEALSREVRIDGQAATIVDLPGTFDLTDHSDGLPAYWELLLAARPDAALVIVDAGDLTRHLPLALAVRDLGIPVVVAANLSDEAAARGVRVDRGRLSQLFGAPVHLTIGRRGMGVAAAAGDAVRIAAASAKGGRAARRASPATPYAPALVMRLRHRAAGLAASVPSTPLGDAIRNERCSAIAAATIEATAELQPARHHVATDWARQVERHVVTRVPLADRLGRMVTAPWPGLPLFALVVVAALLATMQVGGLLSGILTAAWSATISPVLAASVEAVVPVEAIGRAVLWAFDSGLLAMLSVGVPFVLTFYLVLALLEDSGYLAAAAVLSDRLFNAFGLPGRAALPVLAATGCNVPAIYGTRVLATRRERLLASFLIVLTPCSARSAVVIAALAPFAGPGVALAAFGVVAGVAVAAGVGANALVPGRQTPLVLELPPLRAPILRHVLAKSWHRFRSFVLTATPIMVVGSFALGLAYETGALVPVQAVIGPPMEWLLGLPAVAGVALVLAFLRKELAIQLLLVLAIAQLGAGASSLGAFMSGGQLFVYAVVTAISFPCVATFAALVDEYGWRAALVVTGSLLGLALGVGAVLARLVGIA